MSGGVTLVQGVVAADPSIATITGGNTWFIPSGGATAVPVAAPADTTEDILATVSIPALSANAQIRIQAHFTCTSNTNVKTVRVRLGGIGGVIFFSPPLTNSASGDLWGVISNRGATNSQFCNVSAGLFHGLGVSGAGVTGAADTSVATTLVITGQKATAGDTLQLEWCLVEVYKP